PDHALRGDLLLQRLHVAALVVLAHVRTLVVRPLEDDELAALIREARVLAAGGRGGKGGRGLANLGDASCPGGRSEHATARDSGEPGDGGSGDECTTRQ